MVYTYILSIQLPHVGQDGRLSFQERILATAAGHCEGGAAPVEAGVAPIGIGVALAGIGVAVVGMGAPPGP